MRVGFTYRGRTASVWTAGVRYYVNLFTAIRSVEGDRPEIALLTDAGGLEGSEELRALADVVLVEPPPMRGAQAIEHVVQIGRTRAPWLPLPETPYARWLRGRGIDAVFVRNSVMLGLRQPTLSWIPDFQHLHLPHLFSAQEVQERTTRFSAIARHATAVVLSSRASLADFQAFAPEWAHKGAVLPFVAQVAPELYEDDPAVVVERYDLPARFAYLPNQFWAHKNHGVVIDALAQLRRSNPEVAVVCTGITSDNRSPTFFPSLLTRLAERGLRDRMIILGLVPHDDVYRLMRQALVLLQPSIFEGWGTTVEEAKSLGKRLLLSDIPIHREQADADALFFDPRDPDSLARQLAELFRSVPPGPDRAREEAARRALPARMRAFGSAFADTLRRAVRPPPAAP